MIDLAEEMGIDEQFHLASADAIHDQSELIYNGSINGSSDSFDPDFDINSETMRLLFITIITISVLACLSISLSVFICVYLNRRQSFKRQEQKDHLLLPEQSEEINKNQLLTVSSVSTTDRHNSEKKTLSVSIPSGGASTTINLQPTTTTTNLNFYDNLDDIPFIDESRPTSYIDITRV